MKNTIEIFYRAFNDLDAERMVACYHDEVVFEDPAFGCLKGERAKNMWRMLCRSQRGKNFRIHASNIRVNVESGSAEWEAYYTYGKSGRPVHNIVRSEFKFRDGKIVEHTDHFNLYTWAKQALGLPGYLLGWTNKFRRSLNQRTNLMLDRFESIQD